MEERATYNRLMIVQFNLYAPAFNPPLSGSILAWLILCAPPLFRTKPIFQIFQDFLRSFLKTAEKFLILKKERRVESVDERKQQLYSYFENIDDDKKQFALDTIDEYLFFLDRMRELRALPYIRVSKSNPERQELTPAAKLIKEYSQAIDAKRKTLLMILYRMESSAADELLEKLAEFE